MADEDEEAVEEPVHVEDAARLVVDAQLRPGDRLHELLVGAEAAREHDESIGELGHQRLALVHGAHHVQVAQGVVGDLVTGQRLGDHAGGPSARGQRGVGDHAHQPHRGAAVDELDAALGHRRAEALGGQREAWIGPGARAAEDAQRLDGRHAGLPSGTGICGRRTAAGRRTRRTMVSAASLSWMVKEKAAAARAKIAATRKAKRYPVMSGDDVLACRARSLR